MTQEELVLYFSKEFEIPKTDLKNMGAIKDIATKRGFVIIKNKPNDYTMVEKNAISDFRKPIHVINNVPPLGETEGYNGVPLVELTDTMPGDLRYWCYLANQPYGTPLDIKAMSQVMTQTVEQVVDKLDKLCDQGFLTEYEDFIEFTMLPVKDDRALYWHFKRTKRFMPIVI